MKILITYLVYIVLSFYLIGCGGGEEKSDKATPPATPVAPDIPITVTGDLISDSSFEFTSGFDIKVNLMAVDQSSLKHFINVCSDYKQRNDEYIINYSSCQLRTTLVQAEQSFTLSLSSAETKLIAQIWPIKDNSVPINLFWNRSNDTNSWDIDINR